MKLFNIQRHCCTFRHCRTETLWYTHRHCYTPRDTVIHLETLLYTQRHCCTLRDIVVHKKTLLYTQRHYRTLRDTVWHSETLFYTKRHFFFTKRHRCTLVSYKTLLYSHKHCCILRDTVVHSGTLLYTYVYRHCCTLIDTVEYTWTRLDSHKHCCTCTCSLGSIKHYYPLKANFVSDYTDRLIGPENDNAAKLKIKTRLVQILVILDTFTEVLLLYGWHDHIENKFFG